MDERLRDRLSVESAALGVPLDAAQLEAFLTFYHELVEWNQRLNLTAVVAPDEVLVRHFLDSLTLGASRMLRERGFPAATLLDVGTGAGFPGLPLRIAFPELRVTLLEATRKKTSFLEHCLEVLGLPDVVVVWARAEEAGRNPIYRERYDFVVARAVADLSVLAEYCLPFCRLGGTFVAMKRGAVEAEVDRARWAMERLGGVDMGIERFTLPGMDRPHALIVVDKASATPREFPRRPGLAAQRPLGAP